MSQSERNSNNHTGNSGHPKEIIENRLREAGVRIWRSVTVKPGIKASHEPGHTDAENHTSPGLIDGNYTIHGGDGLVMFDVDDRSDLPDWVQDLPDTFTVESPHGGYHLYYIIEDDTGISSTKINGGSIRHDRQYVVGPGSTIDHTRCDDGKLNCPGEGIGTYDIVSNKLVTTLSGTHIEHLREACGPERDSDQNERREYAGDKIILPNEDVAREAEQYICTDFTRHHTQLAGSDKMDLLRGGTGSYDLQRDDGTGIDQSATDYYALDILYGAFLFRGDDESNAKQMALNLFKYYCWENPYDKTGNLRKWLRKGETYLQEQIDSVQQEFDFGKWHRWRRHRYEDGCDADEHRPWADPATDGKPSAITEDTVRAALHILIGDFDPEFIARQYGLDLSLPTLSCGEICPPSPAGEAETYRGYPTAKVIGEMVAELNPEREASYFEETLRGLGRRGEVKMAFCPLRPNGERYVYYPSNLPDPEDARWVRTNGEEYDPEVADGINSWIGEPMMSDTD